MDNSLEQKRRSSKKGFVCEDHFSKECFDPSNELKMRFQEQGNFYLLLIHACIETEQAFSIRLFIKFHKKYKQSI